MLVAVSGYLGTVGSVKISMSQSIIYPTDLARHYNTFLPFSPPTSSLLSFNFWELQEITHSPLSRELYTEITGIACRLVFCVGGLFDFTRKILFFVLSSLRSFYLGRDGICLNTQKIQGREQTERSVKPADIIISYLPYQVVTPVDQSFLSKLESLIWKFHRFCSKLFNLNFTQFCGLRLCQNVVRKGKWSFNL